MPRDTDRLDFFVSYATKDNLDGRITGVVEGILAEHRAFSGGRKFEPYFDKSQIRHGDDWQNNLDHGIAESRVFLAFISPNYFASEWCRKEWRGWIDTEIAKHVFSDGAAPIYIVEVPGFENHSLPPGQVSEEIAKLCELPPPLEAFLSDASPLITQLRRRQYQSVYPFFKEGQEQLRREDLRRILAALAKDLDARAERVRLAAESADRVSPYNKKFSGRVEELLALRKRLVSDEAGVVCGVNGLGGIGKTELAFAYSHAFGGAYPGGRFEVTCEGKATIRETALKLGDYPEFYPLISDEARKTPDTLFTAISSCLAHRLEEKGSILLVLDNVTNPLLMTKGETDYLTMLGPASLHLLMTTRLEPPAHANWLTLGELPESDAMALLGKAPSFCRPRRARGGTNYREKTRRFCLGRGISRRVPLRS